MWNTSIRITSYRLYKNKSYLKRTIVFHHTGSITLWSTEDSNLFLVALIFKFSSWRFCVYKVIVTSLFYNLKKKYIFLSLQQLPHFKSTLHCETFLLSRETVNSVFKMHDSMSGYHGNTVKARTFSRCCNSQGQHNKT